MTVAFKTKQEIAYNVIRESIVTGEFTPGQKLVIATLANRLGMSQIPIREALKTLESEQLILRNGQSLKVAVISVEETIDLLTVRLELESMAIRWASKRMVPEGFEDLEKQLDQMEEAIQMNDTNTFGRLNKKFHYTIYDYCGVDFLIKAIHEAWNQTERARYIFRIIPERADDANKEHREIIEALREKDEHKAVELLVRNLKQSFDLFAQQLLIEKNRNK